MNHYKELDEPFKVKFTKEDKENKTILVPNLSIAFSGLLEEVFKHYGYKAEKLPVADRKAIDLGKKYVHNDMCYPVQINVGEALKYIQDNPDKKDEVVVGLAKNCDVCRAGQYSAVARKALDEMGYHDVPILTTGSDTKNMHPGFHSSQEFRIHNLWGLTILDAMETMRRRIRVYAEDYNAVEDLFYSYAKKMSKVVCKSRKKALNVLKEAVNAFNNIPLKESERRPRIGIIGEILLNFHPASNEYLEEYLEKNGMEVILPTMHDFFRNAVVIEREKAKRGLTKSPFLDGIVAGLNDAVFAYVQKKVYRIMEDFKFYEPHGDIYQLARNAEGLVDTAYRGGEGWLIPGDIIELAKHGVNGFVIVQPFGCIPNHITGRGMMGAMKEKYPHIQVVSLDYDPDTSLGNIENRLQMLIMHAKEMEKVMAEQKGKKQA